ncbi:hypothetical protein [Aquamicrobium zhengzhouense]|uniref:Uncharacterized protein n=1 Tax=Aquamicrobium zhengzhouense TaxID=2781738 RepID=A0ABS0S9T8_9HYPH|nr:hypothetical protein [Aquamicrobium zhengzhouense]MBI1620060.1 hypothetical protein [Aquamicrobium zhengzhouense]
MNLMTLRGLLRKPGNPTMVVDLGNGVPMTIAFQKTPLLEELGKAFNDERTAETGLSYDPETNLLTVDGFVGISEKTGEPNDDFDAAQDAIHGPEDDLDLDEEAEALDAPLDEDDDLL